MPFAARVRLTTRLAALGAWTLVSYAIWFPGALVTLVSGRASRWWNELAVRWWSRGLLAGMGLRVETEGLPPRKPFFLVANHLSYLDILVLGSRFGATFISKHDLARWPVLGHLARITGTIFIDRTVKRDAVRVLGEIDRAMEQGAGVVLFPEGTSSPGDRVYPLKPALLEWAAQRGFPVHAATLRYATGDPENPARDAVCWWGDMSFAPHALHLLSLQQVVARLRFDPQPVVERDRARLAGRLTDTLERGLLALPATEGTA